LSDQGKVNIPQNMEVFTSFYNSSTTSFKKKVTGVSKSLFKMPLCFL
jgi:hypothetical protein